MAEAKPNQAVFSSASQTRTANEIVESQTGSYKCLETRTGNTPPPSTISTPYSTKGG